jgi:phage-related holin
MITFIYLVSAFFGAIDFSVLVLLLAMVADFIGLMFLTFLDY